MKILKRTAVVVMLLHLLACSNQGSVSLTGYAVDYSENGTLIVEAKPHVDLNNSYNREAVWLTNLKEESIGSLLTVHLNDGVDTYPAVSSAKKVIKEQQLQGEKEVVKACLEYANAKWSDGTAAIHSVAYDNTSKEWKITVDNIFNDNMLVLTVNDKEVITEI